MSTVPADHGRRVYTTRLQKGGALVADMRRLTLEWGEKAGRARELVASNATSSPSRLRARDVVTRTFIPRFVRSTPADIWRPLAVLEHASWPQAALLPIHYYVTAASDALLWDFVTGPLAERQARGVLDVATRDVTRWLAGVPDAAFEKGRWTPTVQEKVARGALAALRDFGVLAGTVKKRLTPLYLPVESFAFLARVRREVGVQASAALHDAAWNLFFLSDTAVERFFVEAHQLGLLAYHAAGSLVRLDFPGSSLEDYACELVERTHRVA